MRFRFAVSTFAALSCLTMSGIAAAVVGTEDQSTEHDTQLAGTQWTVETSGDFGTTWSSPLDASGNGLFPVRVNLEALAKQNFYQPLTLRNTVGTDTATQVAVERGRLLEGAPELAGAVRIRIAHSPEGYCAGSLFDSEPDSIGGAPQAPDAPTTLQSLDLEAGTATTPGQSETVCFEFGINRSLDEVPKGEITLAWPLAAAPIAKPTGGRSTSSPTPSDTRTDLPTEPTTTASATPRATS